MSIKFMGRVWELEDDRLTPTHKLVLLKFADCARDDGTHAFPSLDTMAEMCNVSRQTARRSIAHLRELGYLRLDREATPRLPAMWCVQIEPQGTARQGYQIDMPVDVTVGTPEVPLLVPLGYHSCGTRSVSDPSDNHQRDGFDEFWKLYPCKAKKELARQRWAKYVRTPAIRDAIMVALRWQMTQDQWTKDGGRFVPHAATWLNQERWKDERPPDDDDDSGIPYMGHVVHRG